MTHDKYKTCEGCPDRVSDPRCHDTCEGNKYRQAQREKIKAEKRKNKEFNEAKKTAIDYTVNAVKHGYLRPRRNK
jgi:hypothetical protein